MRGTVDVVIIAAGAAGISAARALHDKGVEVIVLEADPAGRRIRVSHKAVGQAQEEAEVREYAEREEAAQTQSFGSLADKLRGALTSKDK